MKFQCSSASRKFLNQTRCIACIERDRVSVLFSEPKIPQSPNLETPQCSREVSVLFSEPKIPQYFGSCAGFPAFMCFSALQRAENSSIWPLRKWRRTTWRSFSALQRAENSSIVAAGTRFVCAIFRFSALQRAENSSIPTLAPASIHISDRDDHASSFLSLPGASP